MHFVGALPLLLSTARFCALRRCVMLVFFRGLLVFFRSEFRACEL